MKSILVFLEATTSFKKEEKKKIEALTRRVCRDASRELGISTPVVFTFYRFGKKNGGSTQAKDWINIRIPRGALDYKDLEGMLYHEMHHIARGYCWYLEKGRHFLLNSLFSEGLATAFEVDKQAPSRKITHDKYTRALIEKWLPQAKNELYAKYYSYDAWFHGKGKPKQLGYKLGTHLVREIKKHHPHLTHKELATKSAKELLKLSKVKF